jgi:hypothetical protein
LGNNRAGWNWSVLGIGTLGVCDKADLEDKAEGKRHRREAWFHRGLARRRCAAQELNDRRAQPFVEMANARWQMAKRKGTTSDKRKRSV